MVKAYIGLIGQISRLFAALATALLIASMLVVCQMILLRYVFSLPTIWQTDFVIFSATGAMFLGAPYVLLKGGHVGVDVVEMMVSAPTRRALKLVGSFLGLLFCLIMLISGWIQFHDAWAGDWKHSSVWAPPLWIPLLALPIGFGLLSLQYTAEILALLTNSAQATTAHSPSDVHSTTPDSASKEMPQ
ncbi:TRAP-type C4-dicarboxylate transport system permease small subunit [Agrobacterium vitis]|nr:TRAP-type C4-dicarboxylate transport system permease small subunit [Agrobacterium vitis]MBE1437638.1 TRAP-type C4-dicarboxylate transport system permease small subunit [Agrobacterium vitis]